MFTSFPNIIDRFSSDRCPAAVSLTEDRHTLSLTQPLDAYITMYGETSVSNTRFEWAVRVNHCGDQQGIIGVATGSALACSAAKFTDEANGYGFALNGLFRSNGQILNGKDLNEHGAISLHEGDVLFIRIDINQRTLSFAKNGILLDITLREIPPTNYRLAVASFDARESFSVVSSVQALADFARYQHNLCQLPLQDRFKHVGRTAQPHLKLLVHNSVVVHAADAASLMAAAAEQEEEALIDTAYGSRWITRGVFEWILQIQGNNAEYVHIGVYGHHQEGDATAFPTQFERSLYGYGITHRGFRLKPQSMDSRPLMQSGGQQLGSRRRNSDFHLGILYDAKKKYKYCSGFSLLDIVHVRLDLHARTLSFTRNGNECGVAYKNVNVAKNFGYRLAVKLKSANCRICIVAAHSVKTQSAAVVSTTHSISQSTLHHNGVGMNGTSKSVPTGASIEIGDPKPYANGNHMGASKSRKSKHEASSSGSSMSSASSSVSSTSLQPSNPGTSTKNIFPALSQLKRSLLLSRAMIDTVCDEFDRSNETELLMRKSDDNNNTQHNHNQNNALFLLPQLLRAKTIGSEVMSAHADFGDSLRNWLHKLTPKIVGHFKNWPNWTSDDIVDWIMTLERARFSKYETHLRSEMKRADLRGKHLKILAANLTHLQRFGIVNFDDETSLHSYINALVSGQYQQSVMKQLLSMQPRRVPNIGGTDHVRSRSKSPRLPPPSTAMKFSKSYQGPLHGQTSSSSSTRKPSPFTLITANASRRSPSPQHRVTTSGQLPMLHGIDGKQSRSHPKLRLFSASGGDAGGDVGVKHGPQEQTKTRMERDTKTPNSISDPAVGSDKSVTKTSSNAQQKMRLLENEYHDMQVRKIAEQRAKLEQEKREFELKQKQMQSVTVNGTIESK